MPFVVVSVFVLRMGANAFLSSKTAVEPAELGETDVEAALAEIERLQDQRQRAIAALRARVVEAEPR